MVRITEKKEKKPTYETPIVVKMDELDRGVGGGGSCQNGSSAALCFNGSAASTNCQTGAAGTPLP